MTTIVIGDNTGDDFSGTLDTGIALGAPTTNYGSSTEFNIDEWTLDVPTFGLVRFSGLSNIPAGSSVTAATLRVYQFNADAWTHTISWYRLLKDWVEMEATGNEYSTGNNWETAGALGATDRSITLSADLSLDGTVGYKDFSSEQLVTDVQGKVDGVYGNFGWTGERTDGGPNSQYKKFRSSESTNDGERPRLSVTYTESGGPPPTEVGPQRTSRLSVSQRNP